MILKIPKGTTVVDQELIENLLNGNNINTVTKVVLPSSVREIEGNCFLNARNLKSINLPIGLTKIGDFAFLKCEMLEKIDLPENLESIGFGAFSGCLKIKEVTIPKNITILEDMTFSNCFSLKKVKLPNNLRQINSECFYETSLKSIKFPEGLKYIGKNAFAETRIKKLKTPNSLQEIGEKAFQNCLILQNVELNNNLKSINESVFFNCKRLENVVLNGKVEKIHTGVFCTCNSIKNIKININNVQQLFDVLDDACSLSHMYRQGDSVILSYDKPKKIEGLQDYVFLDGTMPHIIFKSIRELALDYPNFYVFKGIEDFLKKQKAYVPYSYIELLGLDNFYKCNFKNYKHLAKALRSGLDFDWDNIYLFRFAYVLGCFSENDAVNTKANEWLINILDKKKLTSASCHAMFANIPLKYNQEFFEFIVAKSNKKNMSNFDEILASRNVYLINHIYQMFTKQESELKNGTIRDKNGRLKFNELVENIHENGDEHSKMKEHKPTVDSFIKSMIKTIYKGVRPETEEIAEEVARHLGLKQSHFDRAVSIHNEYEKLNVKPNIVGVHLKENNLVVDAIKKTSGQEDNKPIKSKSNAFKWEWLEKNDVLNYTLGLYCNCCAHLSHVGYSIMRASILHPDVQNLIVRGINNLPVAKATIYVNREKGYALYNTCEVKTTITLQEREEIYNKIIAGTKAFVECYNKKNINKPIEFVNMGTDLNDLRDSIKKNSKPTQMVEGLHFKTYGISEQSYDGNWMDGQVRIWEKPENNKKESKTISV